MMNIRRLAQCEVPQTDKGRIQVLAWVRSSILVVLLVAFVLGGLPSAWAGQSNKTKTINIKIPSHLSITEDAGNFDLVFNNGTLSGDESTTWTVNYTIKGNNLVTTELLGAVNAKISALVDNVDIKADVGTYANQGSSGNSTLVEETSGYVTVGTTAVDLAKKPSNTGNQAKILHGDLPITWKAVATDDLTYGDYPVDLTVTVTDQ